MQLQMLFTKCLPYYWGSSVKLQIDITFISESLIHYGWNC